MHEAQRKAPSKETNKLYYLTQCSRTALIWLLLITFVANFAEVREKKTKKTQKRLRYDKDLAILKTKDG